MIHRIVAAAAISLALTTGAAQAALVETFSNSVAFLAAVPVPNANTVTFGPVGPGPVLDLTGFAASASAGLLTATATTGGLFGASTVLSTEFDQDILVLSFSQPVLALGLFGLVTDEFFNAVDGALLIDVVGSGTATLATTNVGSAFLGFRSDVAFSSVRLSVSSFDVIATAVAFAGLTDTMYVGAGPTAVPAPGVAALLVPAIGLLFARRSRRGKVG